MADNYKEVAPDRCEWVVYRDDGWGAASLLDAARQLRSMSIGHTATVNKRGVPNNEPGSVCTVARVLDGWVIHTDAYPEPPWVGVLRQLVSTPHPSTSEREEP